MKEFLIKSILVISQVKHESNQLDMKTLSNKASLNIKKNNIRYDIISTRITLTKHFFLLRKKTTI